MSYTLHPAPATVSVNIPGHGLYTARTDILDQLINEHRFTTTSALRALAEERAQVDYSDVTEFSTLLIILADFDS